MSIAVIIGVLLNRSFGKFSDISSFNTLLSLYWVFDRSGIRMQIFLVSNVVAKATVFEKESLIGQNIIDMEFFVVHVIRLWLRCQTST